MGAIRLAFHQHAADELGGNHLSGAGEEGWGECGEVLGGGLGGYGSGLSTLQFADSRCGLGDSGEDSHHFLQMSEEQLKAFLEAVKADSALQEKLKTAGDADAVVAIAKDAGFVISAEELQRARAEVSEEELEGVAGGYQQCAEHSKTEYPNC